MFILFLFSFCFGSLALALARLPISARPSVSGTDRVFALCRTQWGSFRNWPTLSSGMQYIRLRLAPL